MRPVRFYLPQKTYRNGRMLVVVNVSKQSGLLYNAAVS